MEGAAPREARSQTQTLTYVLLVWGPSKDTGLPHYGEDLNQANLCFSSHPGAVLEWEEVKGSATPLP